MILLTAGPMPLAAAVFIAAALFVGVIVAIACRYHTF